MLTVKEVIEEQWGIHKFKPRPIPTEFIDQLSEAVRLAPSVSNR